MKTGRQCLPAAGAIVIALLALPLLMGQEATGTTERLHQLLTKRRDTLQQLVNLVTEEYRRGVIGYDAVVRATDRLFDAELAIAENRSARIAAMERRVKLIKSLSAMVQSAFKAGEASQAEVLSAQASVLDAEIELLQEQSNSDKR